MANDVLIDGGAQRAKIRSPWLVLLFGLLSLTIYTWFWWYRINRELASLGAERGTKRLGTSPGLSALAFSLGAFLIVPALWTIVSTHRRARQAQRMTGAKSRLNGGVAATLWILTSSWGGIVYLQSELNKVWHSPGMRPVEETGPATGDLARSQKLRELLDAGALTEEELAAERRRLRLP